MRIDLSGWTREATRGPHADFLALFEKADRLGFDGVWFNEFHFQDPPQPYPSVLLLAAAIFARTARLRVGASVIVLPIHQPLLLAEEIAQLDWQSGGRIDVGMGRGTTPETFTLLGIDPQTRRERFEAAYHAIRRAWEGGGDLLAAIPTVQAAGPPLYVAGYTRETLAFAVAQDLPLLLSLEPNETGQLALYDDILRRTGAPSALARSSPTRHVCIASTRAEAGERFDILAATARRNRVTRAAGQGLPTGEIEALDREALMADQVIWGDPRDCFEQIEALRTRLGVRQLRCVFNGNGLFGHATALDAMTLFAREVKPALG